jgi:hypothetical protein
MLAVVHAYDPEAVFVIFSVYIDESVDDASGRFVVGGFVGRYYAWKRWEGGVKIFQRESGVQRLHSFELYNELKKLNPNLKKDHLQRYTDGLFNNLKYIAAKEMEFGVYGVLRRKDYRSHYLKKTFPKYAVPESEYALCFRSALIATTHILEQQYGEDVSHIHFLMESGGASKDEMMVVYSRFRQSAPSERMRKALASEVAFIDNPDKSHKSLFLADLVARDRRRFENIRDGKLKLSRKPPPSPVSMKGTIVRTDLSKTALTIFRRLHIKISKSQGAQKSAPNTGANMPP